MALPQARLDPSHPYSLEMSQRQAQQMYHPFMYNLPQGMGLGGTIEMAQLREIFDDQARQGQDDRSPVRQSLDLKALNARLQTLGLHGPSEEHLPHHHNINIRSPQSGEPFSPFTPNSTHPRQLGSAIVTPTNQPTRYTTTEIKPSDSISMMNRQPPPRSRRGGTDIDRVEGEYGAEDYVSERDDRSYGTQGGVTMNEPGPGEDMEQLTAGVTSMWGNETRGDMYTMRDRLLAEHAAQEQAQNEAINHQIQESSRLAGTQAKLEAAEEQLRTLQATLIAERVARTQKEQEAVRVGEDARDCKTELAGAIRALRRAREEGKRGDEERRRLHRCFEETKSQLFKYHEELKVRDARAKGREEGRQEAWEEAGRWMGVSPPIPVEPIQQVPDTVLRQTPMMSSQSRMTQLPPTLRSPPQYQTPSEPLQSPSRRQAHSPQQQQNSHSNGQINGNGQFYQPMVIPQALQPQQTGQPIQPQHNGQVHPQQTSHTASQAHPQQSFSSRRPSPPEHQSSGSQMQHQQHQPAGQLGQAGHVPMQFPPGPQPIQQVGQPQYIPVPVPVQTQTVLVPMVPAPNPVQQQQYQQMPQYPIQPQPPQQPYAQGARSVPHRNTALPTQNPPRAATVAHQTPRRAPASVQNTPQTQQTSSRPTRPGTSTVQAPQPESVIRGNPADSYLDRVDHDPRFQKLLSGAPSRTVHTGRSVSAGHPQTQDDTPPVDKPLPNPYSTPSVLGRSQSTRAPTEKPKRAQRMSLTDGLHAHTHSADQIPHGDRYPAFPGVNGKGHSRTPSYGSVDPAGYALPASVDASVFSPQDKARSRHTLISQPQSHSQARSKVAGALRDGTDLGGRELSHIEEMEEEPREQHHVQSKVMNSQPPPIRKAPSVPMRWQPRPVMPSSLGRRAGSEPRHLDMSRGLSDPATRERIYREAPESFDQPGTHPLFVPPGLAPQAIGASVTDGVAGPRHSALGLEGMEAEHQAAGAVPHNYGRHRSESHSHSHSMKAPTIMIQPPSSRSNNLSYISPSYVAVPPPKAGTTKRSTIITEYYDDPTLPHDIPLPKSKSNAPTAYDPQDTVRTQNAPLPPQQPISQPHQIPLPASRQYAPTAYTAASPSPRTQAHRTLPSISVIDYAMMQPLPISRGTTIIGTPKIVTRAATVITEVDVDDPDKPIKKITMSKTVKRKAVPDPRNVPLPASRAGTYRPRASTYARTGGTIDEVTEEESGREGRDRRR